MNRKDYIESILGEHISVMVADTGKITTESGREFFLKSGVKSRTYQCEANGLNELLKAKIIRIPQVISTGIDYILTEYIENSKASTSFFTDFGTKLAKLHQYQGESFGFYEDNYIGANPQLNIPTNEEKSNWTIFYFNKRLLYQYRLAEKNGYATDTLRRGFSRLENKIEVILQGSEEPPTLLHGDLWGGNYLCDLSGNPVLIDPAAYYGHREADLAMTRIFGGFNQSFYDAYTQEYPLKKGWQYRENIYKLYHILNHLNVFGTGYLHEAEYIIKSYTE